MVHSINDQIFPPFANNPKRIVPSWKKLINTGKAFDWGNIAKEYAKYRDIYPPEFYQRIVDLGVCTDGQAALDLGTGTGCIPRNMYHFSANWTGTDIAKNQITEAIRLAKKNNQKIDFFTAPAEKTNLPSSEFDVITACQCFLYLDKAAVLPEIKRMLKPHGRFLTLFMAWLPFENEIAYKSEQLVLKYNPDWNGCNYKRFMPTVPDWSRELFTYKNNISYDVDVVFTRESWHGRMIACRGIGASSISKQNIAEFKHEHWAYMESLPKNFSIPHLVTLLDLRVKQL